MNRILLFCALGALWGCRTVTEPTAEAITLSCSTSESAKVGALTAGDEVAVFARLDGTETYFLEAEKFITGSDGHSLTYGSTVYYPEPKQAVNFYAYVPYHTGSFSVPSDQSTAAALKQADLCWATASTTPVSAPVSLEFQHLFARLIVQTNQSTTKIACRVVSSGSLNPATAQFTLSNTKSEVYTTGNELILPVQPLSRLIITVSGVEYVFEGSINLQPGQTTTLNLTLNATNKTATLNGSSTTAWTASTATGNPTQAVANQLTLHWTPAHTRFAEVNRVVLTIRDERSGAVSLHTISSGVSYSAGQFEFAIQNTTLSYPYTITHIAVCTTNQTIRSCGSLVGNVIYKSGVTTVGAQDVPEKIKIGNLWWATGNLVATNVTAGKAGVGGCKIGAPTDGGLYFQFGSLIGWKGGSEASMGTGEGRISGSLWGKFWSGATAWSWENDAMVWPSNLSSIPTAFPQGETTNQWYFGLQSGWSSWGLNIRDYPGLVAGSLSNVGIGDPCSYYLGGQWRYATTMELASITGQTGEVWRPWTTEGVTGRSVTASQPFYGISGPGAWFGSGLGAGTGTPDIATNLFLIVSGYRESNGVFMNTTTTGIYRGSSIYNGASAPYIEFTTSQMTPQRAWYRSLGMPVRCVSEAP